MNARSFVQIRTVIALLQASTWMDVMLDYGLCLLNKHTADKTQYFSYHVNLKEIVRGIIKVSNVMGNMVSLNVTPCIATEDSIVPSHCHQNPDVTM